ncbi:MAG: glycosyltransferase family 39 protein [Candidatus Blackburnbacteria bacterium]|nr:glycosyltransferase family 39 protein [Candidatus Blackburnbacteria bacterium]
MRNFPRNNKLIFLIFFIGLIIRFLYFPQNIYFAYDQARDSFTSLEILKGDFKIVGPPSAASDKLFPGPLIFYVYAPLYWLGGNSPEIVAAFLRIFNALGIFLVFLIGSLMFNRYIGLITALFFAVSYEQSQYSLFISHQPLAVIPVLIFYLGLNLLFFKKDKRGLILTTLGWGTSIQFHYVYILLGVGLFLLALLFRHKLPRINHKIIIISVFTFLTTVSTYILSEIKFDFRLTLELFSGFLTKFTTSNTSGPDIYPSSIIFTTNRFLHDSFLANFSLTFIPGILLIVSASLLLFKKETRKKLAFLCIWLLGGLLPYFLSGTPSYYYSAAASVSLFLLAAYLIHKLYKRYSIVALTITIGIIVNNIYLISTINHKGPNSDIVIQPGMLLSSEKQALDYIYTNTKGEPFAVRSLTIPFNINTTWSYIFEWYGNKKYGKLPLWIGPVAKGYPGNIPVIDNRSSLPSTQFLIIEPTVGIRNQTIEKFFEEENYFTRIEEEKSFGTVTVQKRQKI